MFPTILDKEEMQDNELNLIKSEINRARHFIDHSNNPDEQIKIIDNWLDEYGLNYNSDQLLEDSWLRIFIKSVPLSKLHESRIADLIILSSKSIAFKTWLGS